MTLDIMNQMHMCKSSRVDFRRRKRKPLNVPDRMDARTCMDWKLSRCHRAEATSKLSYLQVHF